MNALFYIIYSGTTRVLKSEDVKTQGYAVGLFISIFFIPIYMLALLGVSLVKQYFLPEYQVLYYILKFCVIVIFFVLIIKSFYKAARNIEQIKAKYDGVFTNKQVYYLSRVILFIFIVSFFLILKLASSFE